MLLQVKDLVAKLSESDKVILKGVNLEINPGEVHAIMGPNGSGKSTLANVIMGNPKYEVVSGDIFFEGESILELRTDERAQRGIMMTFQNPYEIEGVKLDQLLLIAYRKLHGEDKTFFQLDKEMKSILNDVSLPSEFLERFVNLGFSGGERKKGEILQARFLKPKLLILDEIDSGLDVDALRIVASQINKLKEEGTSLLIITHYARILNYLDVDKVHVYVDGKVALTGDKSLAYEVEETGYAIVNGSSQNA
ncbi:MAG: Fe-S cluster assembly ATPase SufC [Fervidobacterium sp.]|uniref:Iron-regulated ABC transporter ATPase subunit SufC n=1 Tax=Fervidobacterium gondwanense DSM 13020 TaxID=1121883 RepID=A0A1M7SS97_FERGO|nr:Fe-S cluster assembly ATPase SufC [Fervidobacterium gondwanense]UXF00585.1 ABC transporter ATP-binding protein [Fervidobacterium riparium]SHN61298.1 Iron-regulated ABC transporter ATPase subunit SufC [Fervidobacterium gondwanense DSM 13020]